LLFTVTAFIPTADTHLLVTWNVFALLDPRELRLPFARCPKWIAPRSLRGERVDAAVVPNAAGLIVMGRVRLSGRSR
jgi:hypothetical protein